MKSKFSYFTKLFFLFLVIFGATKIALAFWDSNKKPLAFVKEKDVVLNENDLEFRMSTQTNSVEDFLEEQKIEISREDRIFPTLESKIFPGTIIRIARAQKLKFITAEKEQEITTFEPDLESAIKTAGIDFSEDDLLEVKKGQFADLSSDKLRKLRPTSGISVNVIKVEIKTETEEESIAFETKTEEDDELSWRKKVVKQAGEKGIEKITYRVVYHNNKEMSRKIISSETVKEPVTEIVTQGTYIDYGKTHNGLGTWYSNGGELTAASPWLPMGSYCEVENTANGKRVIVKINDRGPFGENRIIDLETTAFSEIANLGAGVIDVKVREIRN